VYSNDFLGVRNDPVIFPNGTRGHYLSLHAPSRLRIGGVAMLAAVGERLLFIRNFRHAPRRWELEVPRGFVDLSESPEASARRELLEECGLTPTSVRPLGTVNPDSGLFAFETACFWCTLDYPPSEVGEHVKTPPILLEPRQAFERLASGELRDGFSAYCLASALAHELIRF
jgi:ADP-ribose pyrophosphatase